MDINYIDWKKINPLGTYTEWKANPSVNAAIAFFQFGAAGSAKWRQYHANTLSYEKWRAKYTSGSNDARAYGMVKGMGNPLQAAIKSYGDRNTEEIIKNWGLQKIDPVIEKYYTGTSDASLDASKQGEGSASNQTSGSTSNIISNTAPKEGAIKIMGSSSFKFVNGKWEFQGSLSADEAAEIENKYSGNSSDASFEEYVTFQEYLNSLPDNGAAMIEQWEDLAEEQLAGDFEKLKDNLQQVYDIYIESADLEAGIAGKEKERGEKYLQEDLDRFLQYASEDRTKALTETDTAFAKALSNAATGYMNQGIRLASPGLMRRTATNLRETRDPIVEGIETIYGRGVKGAERDKERGGEDLSSGYKVFLDRQALERKAEGQKKESEEEELDIEKKKLKAGIAATRKAEARIEYTSSQLKKY